MNKVWCSGYITGKPRQRPSAFLACRCSQGNTVWPVWQYKDTFKDPKAAGVTWGLWLRNPLVARLVPRTGPTRSRLLDLPIGYVEAGDKNGETERCSAHFVLIWFGRWSQSQNTPVQVIEVSPTTASYLRDDSVYLRTYLGGWTVRKGIFHRTWTKRNVFPASSYLQGKQSSILQ